MKMFLRRKVVDQSVTPYKLIQLDVPNTDNLLPLDNVSLTTEVNALLKESKCTSEKRLGFKKF